MKNALLDQSGLQFLTGASKIRVTPAQIIRLESMSNYTKVYFADHVPIVMAKVLRAYEVLLRPYGFVRIHNSHLVNMDHVKDVDELGTVQMRDNSRLKFSRRKRREALILLMNKSIYPSKISLA